MIRAGICGFGYWGPNLFSVFSTTNPAFRVVAIADWLAAAIVCLCLLAAFRIGIDRGFRDTIGDGAGGASA
jgi:hypothetical protein